MLLPPREAVVSLVEVSPPAQRRAVPPTALVMGAVLSVQLGSAVAQATVRSHSLDARRLAGGASSWIDDAVRRNAAVTILNTTNFEAETVTRILQLVDTAEYKRRQYPPGTKITSKGFGKDRRLPITNRYRG